MGCIMSQRELEFEKEIIRRYGSAHLEQLQMEVDELRDKNSKLREENGSIRCQVEQLSSELLANKDKFAKLEEENLRLKEIENSLTWRMTAPVRNLIIRHITGRKQ